MKQFRYEARDGLDIVAYEWSPAGPTRGIVQVTHGMGEHVLRYSELAAVLNEAGFAVFGQDHRGHGATAGTDSPLGEIGANGWSELVNDIGLLSTRARATYPEVPLVLLGHSMGSFAVQQYLLDNSTLVDAAVLTGTAAIDLAEPMLDLDADLDLTFYNAPFAPARTDYDWLTRDESQVDVYIADPRCGFNLDRAATKAMFAGARATSDPTRLARMRKDLPLYVAVGEADPVGGMLALVHPLVERYGTLADVTLKTYPQARHEVFNETNRDEVYADLLTWLDRVTPQAKP